MQTFAIDDAAADTGGGDNDDPTRHAVADALGTTGFALNRYHLPPGTGLPSGLHAHLDQEEVFVALDGEVTFQTLSDPVVVGAGEAVRFAPGEYQTGANESDEAAVVLAIGAPKESEAVRVPLTCPDCGARGLSPEWDDGEVLLACPDCGGEHRTRGCPECGRAEMQAASGDTAGEVVVVCPDCGAEWSEPRWSG
jgi:uncharacterized cupin superfamily protein